MGYQEKIKKEGSFWDQAENHLYGRDETEFLPKEIIEYYNESYTGAKDIPWWRFIGRFGSFEKGISLGCGTGLSEKRIMDAGICKEMDLVDLSEGALKEARKRLEGYNCHFFAKDINNIELPDKTYDFILGDTSFHHFANLEKIAEEIKKTLKDEGIFVLYDVVGEKRLQWDENKLEFASHILKTIPLRYRINLSIFFAQSLPILERIKWFVRSFNRIEKVKPETITPFEAIRSDEIMDIMTAHFEPVFLRKVHGLISMLLINNVKLRKIKNSSLLQFICNVDRLLTQSEMYRDMHAFCVFKCKKSPVHID